MGGRGASSGMSDNGKEYGTEYKAVLRVGNIKFVKYKDSDSAKTPMETMTKGRVYATINNRNVVAAITYYDSRGKRKKQIDLLHEHEGKRPHAHYGYYHDENGTDDLTKKDRKMVDKVTRIWYNHLSKQ